MSSLPQRLRSILINQKESRYICSQCHAVAFGYDKPIPHTEDCRVERVLLVALDVGNQIDRLIGHNDELHRRLGDYPETDVEEELRA